jgi:Tfp pilus assembly protein FimV
MAASRPPTSQVRPGEPAAAGSGRVGIDHAISLIRSLPTDKNVDLVVKVLKTTLESLGIRIQDIVLDAAQRQKELQARVGQLKSEIEHLQKEIEQRSEEIVRLDAAYAETTKVRGYLDDEQVDLIPDDVANA